jgi:hypothetical protein
MATKIKTLRVTEVAKMANRGLSTVYRDISRGVLSSTRNSDGYIVVPASAARTYTRQSTPTVR